MVDITRRTFILGAIAGVGVAVADNTLTARAGMLPARKRTLFGAFCGPDRYPNVNPTEEKWEMQAAVRARMARTAILLVVVAGLGALTLGRTAEYGSTLTLARTVVERRPTAY